MVRKFKIGELQTTIDINQKFLMGVLNGDEVWAFEDESKIKKIGDDNERQ